MDLEDSLDQLEELFKKKNVFCIGKGNKFKDGKDTGKEALVFLVEKKEDTDTLSEENRIPPEIGGIPTDVEQAEPPKKLTDSLAEDRKGTWKTLKGGISIGNIEISAGSNAAMARVKIVEPDEILKFPDYVSIHKSIQPGEHVLTSNAHVFCADATKLVEEQEKRICQPGRYHDKNSPVRAELLGHGVIDPDRANLFDAAFARCLDGKADNYVLGIGRPSELVDPRIGQSWEASTMHGMTEGAPRMTGAAVKVSEYAGKTVLFVNQVITSYMLEPGASGSDAFLKGTTKLVAKGFAGSKDISVFSPIKTIYDNLRLELIPEEQKRVINLGTIILEKDEKETWTIKGENITDKEGDTLKNVTVDFISDDQKSTIWTSDGTFMFLGIKESPNAKVIVSCKGFLGETLNITFKDE